MKSKTIFQPLFLFFVLIASFSVYSQDKKELDSLVSSYKKYSELPREVSYAHLNKTLYVKGEIMGFTTYIFDKSTKKPSKTATNVYCTVSDENNKIIKSEMILASNGVANGSFQIDSLFNSGQYVFRAYTNWMRNFDEQNYYTQSIKIINSETESRKDTKAITSNLDAQFLPEGGHLVAGINNSVGVIIKDSLGFGVPNVSGKVVDAANKTLTNFKTNNYGMGKFFFTPTVSENYKVILEYFDKRESFPIEKAESKGIALTMNDLENKVALSFRTNNETLPEIKKKNYTLAIHNGSALKTIQVSFGDSLEVIKMINYEYLSSGVNIFTLFDENNQPILERVFFKYEGINLLTTQNPEIKNSMDSLTIKIPIKNIDATVAHNFSISVLPEETKSYNPSNNIISATYLQPYIKSYVENAPYYFTDITRKKKFELDNVMLTQGWSSFDWKAIFNNPPKAYYNYENGIEFIANINGKNALEYMMYATINNEMKIFDLNEGDNNFGAIGLYPMDTEEIRFSEINKNKGISKPSLFLMFSPSKIPDLDKVKNIPPQNEKTAVYSQMGQEIFQSSWDSAEQLDEVVVRTDKVLSREEKLTRNSFGEYDVLDDKDRKTYGFFADYIRMQGFLVEEHSGLLNIYNPRPIMFGDSIRKPMTVYLDNIRLLDTQVLSKYRMDNVDYVYINKSAAGEVAPDSRGIIKIFTDPSISESIMERNATQSVKVPLTFTTPKKFYTPRYSIYNSRFFKNYGVIDWLPNLKLDDAGNIQFTILKPQTESFKLFLEGTANDGSLLSEEKTLPVPKL